MMANDYLIFLMGGAAHSLCVLIAAATGSDYVKWEKTCYARMLVDQYIKGDIPSLARPGKQSGFRADSVRGAGHALREHVCLHWHGTA